MAVFNLFLPKDINIVDTNYYTLYIHKISFEYLNGNVFKSAYKALPNSESIHQSLKSFSKDLKGLKN